VNDHDLKMVSSLALSRSSSDFDAISYADLHFCSKNDHITNISIFLQMLDWRTTAILKIVFWLYVNYLFSG